jgi:XTP/dITP diphosphohydrolase
VSARAGPGASGPRGAAPALLIATFNAGKAREFSRLLAAAGFESAALRDGGIEAPYEESDAGYDENARGKALHYAALAGRIAIADDSGLEVEALGGRPGPLSARYGGPDAGDPERCLLILRELEGVPEERRGARYVAAVSIARPDREARLFRGVCEGRIAAAPRGAEGFGYDPIFFYPPFGATFGEVARERKDRVSHRAVAFRALVEFLRGAEGREFLRAGA